MHSQTTFFQVILLLYALLKNGWKYSLLQAIAQENNLSETAFFVPEGNGYHIRWFTPVAEVDLCGHATLATAFVIFNYFDTSSSHVSFHSKSGRLTVVKRGRIAIHGFSITATCTMRSAQGVT